MSKKNKEVAEQKDEEQGRPKEPSPPGKNETQSFLFKIENLEKDNEKIMKKLA